MTRYKQLNEHYILDTYTRKKLTLKDVEKLLNTYEETLQNQRRIELCQTY